MLCAGRQKDLPALLGHRFQRRGVERGEEKAVGRGFVFAMGVLLFGRIVEGIVGLVPSVMGGWRNYILKFGVEGYRTEMDFLIDAYSR